MENLENIVEAVLFALGREISIDEPLNKDCDGNELLLSDILGTDPDITSVHCKMKLLIFHRYFYYVFLPYSY